MGTNETTLRPCPFCGAEPIMRIGIRGGFWALCERCGAQLRMSNTMSDAVRNWNSRAPEADIAAMSAPITDAEREADIKAKWRADCAERRAL